MAKTPIATSGQPVAGGSFRIPPAHEGLQVNSCRNPECPNFGVEALAQVTRGRPKAGSSGAGTDLYILSGQREIAPDSFLKCRACNRTLSIKSNRAIAEEVDRLAGYLQPRPLEDVCRTPDCENALFSVTDHPERYASQGVRGKSQRYRCKACKRTFSVSQSAHLRQRAPHENKTIFKELVSKKPIRGIIEMTELGAPAVYAKIDFIYRQCLGFAGERERRLSGIERKHVRLCVDRQDYMVNWRRRQDRKNVQMTAICTVDYDSGYVLGHHLNYDPFRDQRELDDVASANGDLDPTTRSYFRTFPQYWLTREFYSSVDTSLPPIRPDLDAEPLLVGDLIKERERQRRKLKDAEKDDVPTTGSKLPQEGVMTHLDYTAYAHARLMRRFLAKTKHVTVYMDQDEVSRSAFVSAFAWKIISQEAEMAMVQFQKQMDIDTKRELSKESRQKIAVLASRLNELPERAIATKMAFDYVSLKQTTPSWRDRWIAHPKNTINEPLRRVLYLTDTGAKDPMQIGWTLSGATLAPVDNYFMRLRRKVNYFERPLPTRSNAGRLWTGYQPYDPMRVVQLLEIFRVYTNFILTDTKGETPAMKFGLAKGTIRFEDILYWRPNTNENW